MGLYSKKWRLRNISSSDICDINDINDVGLHSQIDYDSVNHYDSLENMNVDAIVDYIDNKCQINRVGCLDGISVYSCHHSLVRIIGEGTNNYIW